MSREISINTKGQVFRTVSVGLVNVKGFELTPNELNLVNELALREFEKKPRFRNTPKKLVEIAEAYARKGHTSIAALK